MKKLHLALVSGLLTIAVSLTAAACVRSQAAATATPAATATSKPPTRTPTATPAPTSTATPTATPTQPAYTAVFEPGACSFDIPPGLSAECGFVVVPEDRSGDPADTIQLAVAVYASTSDTPAPDPVIFLQGGPGGGAVESLANYFEAFIRSILVERDLIVFDQRGTGLSNPTLDCWELVTLYLEDLREPFPEADRNTLYTNALLTCRDRLISKGANLAAYTSAASAADVNDIITVLGYDQVNLYGVSYGTRLAQTVMRDFPHIVRSAVLDSVLPIDIELYYEQVTSGDFGLNVLFNNCASDPACNSAYPDLEAVFFDLVDQLDASPITANVTDPLLGQPRPVIVSGARFMGAVVWGIHSSNFIPLVPQTIYDVRAGDYSSLSYYLALPVGTFANMSLGMMISVSCHEQVFVTTPEGLEAYLAANPSIEALELRAIFDDGQAMFSACEQWGAAPFNALETEPLVSDIPTLIIAGEYDSATPPLFGRRTHETLSNSYFFELAGQGHVPSMGESRDCPLSIALEFLSDPTSAPDDSCIAEMDVPQFVLPFQAEEVEFEPFTNEEMGFSGVVPSGWTEAGYGYYNRDRHMLDPTTLAVQGAYVSAEYWLDWLTEQFGQVGLEKTPRAVGKHKTDSLTWTLYAGEYKGNPLDLALAESDGLTLQVLLLSSRRERDTLYEAVFMPVMDALTLIE